MITAAKPTNRETGFATMRAKLGGWIKRLNGTEKATLKYVEVHLTDHCNLNCKGCGHFSPIADEKFAALDVFEKDVRRLGELFANVTIFRLMGGEPLMHPEVNAFMRVARQHLPRSDLRVVTNGLLLRKMDQAFWDTCRAQDVQIDLSQYPIKQDLDHYTALAARNGVRLNISSKIKQFLAGMNLEGDSDPKEAIEYCRSFFYCPYMQDGRLHVCVIPATVQYFNRKFNLNIPPHGGIDIHDPRHTGAVIVELLEQPVDTCRFCVTKYRKFDWAVSKGTLDEWKA